MTDQRTYEHHHEGNPPTIEQFLGELLDICLTFPGRSNPTDGNSCLYTHEEDKNWHCLIGEWLTRHMPDVDLDHCEGDAAKTVLAWQGMPSIICEFGNDAQGYADNRVIPEDGGLGHSNPRQWLDVGRDYLLPQLVHRASMVTAAGGF